MITLLEAALDHADGSYLTPEDLNSLDAVIQSWALRRQTYELIQAQEGAIVEQALTQLSTVLVKSSRIDNSTINKCRRDMTAVIRSCATAMLLQDEELLKDRFLYWMQNIMHAVQNQKLNGIVYQALQQAVAATLPSPNADLLMPYLQLTRDWLS